MRLLARWTLACLAIVVGMGLTTHAASISVAATLQGAFGFVLSMGGGMMAARAWSERFRGRTCACRRLLGVRCQHHADEAKAAERGA